MFNDVDVRYIPCPEMVFIRRKEERPADRYEATKLVHGGTIRVFEAERPSLFDDRS
jgi:hypothetical protein